MKHHLTLPLTLLFLAALLLSGCTQQTGTSDPARANALFSVDMKQVSTIKLSLPDEEVVLSLRGSRWVLPEWNNYPAEPTFADILVRTLSNLPDGEVVTNIAGDYGLTPTLRRIVLEDEPGARLGELWVGLPLDNYRAAYVSAPNLGEVRRVKADLIPALARPTWGDRTVWRLPNAVVQEIDVRGFDRNFKARDSGDEGWQLVDAPNLKLGPGFGALLMRLLWLKAGDVVYEPNNSFEAKAGILVKTQHVDMVLHLGPLNGDIIHARADRQDIIFHFSKKLIDLVENAVEEI